MKITVQSVELKTVLALVRAVGECSTAKVAARSVCTVEVADNNIVNVGFAFNGSFLSYRFREAMVEGWAEPMKRSFDLTALASLKFPEKLTTLTLDPTEKAIGFSSGRLRGKLLLTNGDLDDEEHCPKEDAVVLSHTFSLKDFLGGLSCHNYGVHHNPVEAAKRAVRIYTDKDRLKFVSRDSIVTSYINIESRVVDLDHAFDVRLLPKPLKTVLSSLPDDVSPTFRIGLSKEFWHINHDTINIWFPNIIKSSVKVEDIEDLVGQAEKKSSCRFTLPLYALESAMKEAQPFVSDATLTSKDDTPTLKFVVTPERVAFRIETSKAKDVEIMLDGKLEIDPGQPLTEEIGFNFKFLMEFVSAFKSLTSKKEDPSVTIQWWKYQAPDSPGKGKAACLTMGTNRFFVLRVKSRGVNV